jgi:hypothetical protein
VSWGYCRSGGRGSFLAGLQNPTQTEKPAIGCSVVSEFSINLIFDADIGWWRLHAVLDCVTKSLGWDYFWTPKTVSDSETFQSCRRRLLHPCLLWCLSLCHVPRPSTFRFHGLSLFTFSSGCPPFVRHVLRLPMNKCLRPWVRHRHHQWARVGSII